MTLKHDQVRETVLAKAEQLVETQGLEALKARPLAAAAGISVGTFYNLFGSIDDLMKQVNHNVMDEYLVFVTQQTTARFEALRLEERDEDYIIKHLMVLAEVYLDFIEMREKKWAAVLAFNAKRDPNEPDDRFRAQQASLLNFIALMLKDTKLGNDPKMLEKAARTLWSSTHGVIVLNYLGLKGDLARQNCLQLIELFVTYFVKGLFVESKA